MPLIDFWLPNATPLDPAEDPPGSLDPLGTLQHAERLAQALLPGFTGRMWRARLLTFATVAAAVADRSVVRMDGREDIRLNARLAFERLFVSAVVQMSDRIPTIYGKSTRQLPGNELANTARREGEPLTASNFLKGQAVNGPFGVIAQLARRLELIDDDGRLGRNGPALVIAWANDEGLPGVFDDHDSKRDGAIWMTDAVGVTVGAVGEKDWPRDSHRIWEQLAKHLRPDRLGKGERRLLFELLEGDTIRRRVIELLKERVEIYWRAQNRDSDRGLIEREVLIQGLRPELTDDTVDRSIATVISAVDAYEQSTGILQQVFDGFVWALKQYGGRAKPEKLLKDVRLARHLEQSRAGIGKCATYLERAIKDLDNQPAADIRRFIEPMSRLREDAIQASASVQALTGTVLTRHERVQRAKSKAQWIERDSHWTLMPGENRVDSDAPPNWTNIYLHPFKIPNAYAILGDLRQVAIENQNVNK